MIKHLHIWVGISGLLLILLGCQQGETGLVAPPQSQPLEALPTAAVAVDMAQLAPPPTPTPQLRPLIFPPDSDMVVLNDTLSATETAYYVFDGTAGQLVNLTVLGDQAPLDVQLLDPNLALLKSATVASPGWHGRLPLDGQYRLLVSAGVQETTLTLTLSAVRTANPAGEPTTLLVPFTHGLFTVNLQGQALDATYFTVNQVQLVAQSDGRTADLPIPQPNPIPLGVPESVLITDMNRDGFLDLAVLAILGSGGERIYNGWLYDPNTDTFVWIDDINLLTTPHFRPDGVVESLMSTGGTDLTRELYRWEETTLVAFFEERCQRAADGSTTHTGFALSDGSTDELFRRVGDECALFGLANPLADVLADPPAEVVAPPPVEPPAAVVEAAGDYVLPVDLGQGTAELRLQGEWLDDGRSLLRIEQAIVRPVAGAVQTLVVNHVDGVAVYDPLTVLTQDFNEDGRPDLSLLKTPPGNNNRQYDIFLYDPASGQYQLSPLLSSLVSPEVLGDGVLRSTFTDDSGSRVVEIYEWTTIGDNPLRPLLRETCQPNSDGTFTHTGFQFNEQRVPVQTFQSTGAECVDFGLFD